MNIFLCNKCADVAKGVYTIKRLTLAGKSGKCGHCGRKTVVNEHEMKKRSLGSMVGEGEKI